MGQGFMEKIRNFFTLEEEELPEELEPNKSRWKGSLVSLTSSRHHSIVILEPATIGEAQDIGDHLKNRAAVLVNLQGLERELANRILDFISGMTYALNGSMQKVADSIFLFVPPTITVISAQKKREIKEKGELFFKKPL